MQKVRLDLKGFVALRNSSGVIADLQARAARIADAAGEGVEAQEPTTNRSITGRARVSVLTTTADAMIAEATDGALSRAIGAGGD